ncbi:MAG: cell division ATP-binding protein FtsE [Lachnospiraceae bacterium]|nr:cell division ATP-binding protein FtsE [Lachnospiraceae bacterium]MBP5185352.1 cell division ATP-binding protein FtsE [Lachnospiraceae bacterium]
MAIDIERDAGKKVDAPVILFDGVSKSYQKSMPALRNVKFEVRKGEFVFIVGASGSGKSTLIKLMTREIKANKGRVFVNGRDIGRLYRGRIAKYRRGIGIVFQDFRLLPDLNVYENVAFAQRVIEAPAKEIPNRVAKALSIVGLSDKAKSYPDQLSGGEQQRVAIARALINNPTLLLADEPTGNLDPANTNEIMRLLEEVNRRGTTVVVVTHNREMVNRMQKRVIKMDRGQIVSDASKGGYRYV